ncbi:MAG: SPASM domain-containing protein, partial [Acidimicrobiales bacterium]|nr:SPASM domain-containing protein [Acidimicrobiales bacterium]
QFYIVEPNGDIAHCDNFLGDPDYQFGNITTQTFAEVRSDPRMQRLVEQNKAELEAMSSCPGFDVCQGWCPHERYTSRHHNPDHDPGCCGRLPLIDHFRHDRRAKAPTGVAVSLSAPRRSGPQEARDESRPTR